MPSLRKAPIDSPAQVSRASLECGDGPGLASRSRATIQDPKRSIASPLPNTRQSAAHNANNPFLARQREMPTGSHPEASEVSNEASNPLHRPQTGRAGTPQRLPTHLAGLPRYSSTGKDLHQVGSCSSTVGTTMASLVPRYTAQDYADRAPEKQGPFLSNISALEELDEKSELQESPIQEHDTSLPFQRDGDTGVAEMGSNQPYDGLCMEDVIPHLVAIDTKEFERYQRAYCYPEKFYEPGRPTIDPFTTSFEGPRVPEGWRVFIHPEGARYFYCDEPSCPVPVLTDAWIYDSEAYGHIHDYMHQIFRFMKDHDISFRKITPSQYVSPSPRKKRRTRNGSTHFQFTPSNDPFEDSYPQHLAPTVLVLDMRLSGKTGYYFVSHPTQTIFWLDPFDYSLALGEVHTDYSQTLIGLEMKRHYWAHNDLFPHLYELEEKDIEEVDDMIGFAIGDALTSLTGVVTTFTPEQLKQLQHIIHRYDMKRWEKRRKSVGERRMICRVISDFYHERFLNLHGERGARLNCTQSIHFSDRQRQKFVSTPSFTSRMEPWYKRLFQCPLKAKSRFKYEDEGDKLVNADPPIDKSVIEMHRNSWYMNLLSLLMLGGPGIHLKRLRDMTVDRVVSKTVLTRYMEKMMEEWRDVTLYGTVLLGANVSFLTIQSVDDAGRQTTQRTGSQRASYFSVLASMGTIVSSFMLLGRHREVMNYTFIAHRSNSRWGLESLALMYGMPFSLAIWSIISFFLSFAILWFDNTDYVVMGIVGSFSLLFTFFLIWAILAPYEKHPYQFFVSRAAEGVRSAGKHVRKRSAKAVKSVKQRLSTVGVGVVDVRSDGSSPSPPGRKAASLPNPQLSPMDLGEGVTSLRTSLSSSVTRRISGVYTKHHRKTWSESPSETVEGDGEPPEKNPDSLDTGQTLETFQRDGEQVPWSEKNTSVKFQSPV